MEILQRTVSSQYADGLFVQEKDSTGKIYNVQGATVFCAAGSDHGMLSNSLQLSGANPKTMEAIEKDMQRTLAMFKARYKWLTTDR